MRRLVIIVLVVSLLFIGIACAEVPGLKPGPTATPTLQPPRPGDPTPTPVGPYTSGIRYYRIRCYPGCHPVQKNPYTRWPKGYQGGQ